MTASFPPPSLSAQIEAVTHAVCPFLRMWRHEEKRDCQRCPAKVELEHYGPATQMCRSSAEEVARAALATLERLQKEGDRG